MFINPAPMRFFSKILMKLFPQGNQHSSKWDFQGDAVDNVVVEFEKNPAAKKMIVIPTGGGKTIVGLQLVKRLIDNGFLRKDNRALWTVHTKYLKTQTEKYINHDDYLGLREAIGLQKNILDFLEIRMNSETEGILGTQERLKYGLLIIDEAHHAGAPSYQPFFSYNIGIIGLTATPTRLDRRELPFQGIAYSVKFSTLEKLGVIAMPIRENIKTDFLINATNLNYSGGAKEISKFDTPERNRFIAEWIFKNRRAYGYKKIVVFTGSKSHAKNLFKEISDSNEMYGSPFQTVGYILGGDVNNEGISNDSYLESQKELESSILVNCQILNEGYDDPNLDTVIMATPSNSTVYYMQCMGRVVRVAKGKKTKKAFVFEFVDKLPNITYRVDNRWLYGEIEQELLPIAFDPINYSSDEDIRKRISEILAEHRVDSKYVGLLSKKLDDDFGLLLVTDSKEPARAEWFPLLIDSSDDGRSYLNAFNKLSYTINSHAHYGYGQSENDSSTEYIVNTFLGIKKDDLLFASPRFAGGFVYALARAYSLKEKREMVDCIKYYTFKREKEGEGILDKIWKLFRKIITKLRIYDRA